MTKPGSEYEAFVARLVQAILDADEFFDGKNMTVEKNKIIEDTCGINREFDVYWEYEFGELVYKTVIECKDYNTTVSIDNIDALIGKSSDIPDLKLVFATKKGYQSGAKRKANKHGIDLLIVREQDESDWQLDDGTPLIKKLVINLHVQLSPRIVSFMPVIDGHWVSTHTDIDTTKPFRFVEQTDQVFIEDVTTSQRLSLKDVENQLRPYGDRDHGKFEVTVEFDDAYLVHRDLRLKMRAYNATYIIAPPIHQPIEIDYSNELIGVVEYLEKGTKKKIFGDKIVDGRRRRI